jgi:predicted ATPase
LFTDLEGSTRLLHELGDRYDELLETHRRLIREAVSAHHGIEFGTGGDALFVVFTAANDAVTAARDAQRALRAFPWPPGARLRVRMALHTGEARVVDDDYVGAPLHVVARMCAAGNGEQILLSDATHGVAQDPSVISLGTHRLRDVPDEIEIFQLAGEGLDGDFPPLKTLSAQPNNLPFASDQLVGRELDIVEVAEAVSAHRLVTLTGVGGVGKTRLALEVAASMLGEFSAGVWFVPLASASSGDQVAALTAKELGIGERGAEPLTATLQRQLAARDLLIVLDNCEHLVDAAAAFVDGLLTHAAKVRVLATSRELLGVRGEQAYAVTPLSVGAAHGAGDAISLFMERARAAVSGFDFASEELDLVVEVCRRLDGLPLAIELAAARLRSMSLRQLADRLDDRFRLLSTGPRTVGARQRTLEAVIAWSYELLDEPERAAFRRLSVFADSFTLEAADSVATWGVLDGTDITDLVARLVDKSLLVTHRAGAAYRYSLLETLRHYGRAQLAVAGERSDATAHLLGWARDWADLLERDMRTVRQDASLSVAAYERENLRAAYEEGRATGDRDLALRIVTFAPIMPTRDREHAITELLAEPWEVSPPLRGHALTSLAQFRFGIGMAEEGIDAARRAASIFEQLGDVRHAVWARYFEIFSAWGLRPDDDVRRLVRDVVMEFRELDEPLGVAYLLWVTSQLESDVRRAHAYAAESEALFRSLDSPFGLAHNLEGRALICIRDGETSDAGRYLSEALAIFVGADEQGCTAHCLEAIATLLASDGLVSEAREMLRAAEAVRRDTGHTHRPWELRSRVLAEQLLPADLDDTGRTDRDMSVTAVTSRAAQLLDATLARTSQR